MKRLILPLMALAACQPAPEAPTPEPPPPTTSPAPSTSSTAPPTTSTSTSSTTTTVTTVMQPEPEPVVSTQRAAGGPGVGTTALVSWYGDESGSTTANGETYNPDGLSFAHRSMPFGTLVEFCRGGRCVVARCNDRGPFIGGRTFDLSRGAFAVIAPLGSGVVTVTWSRV